MTTHSRIGASSMFRWKNCPGSVRLSAGIHSKSSEYAAEGTAAHDLAERCLTERVNPGALSDNREMGDAVDVYLTHIYELEAVAGEGDRLVEHKFHLKDIHEDLFGTADYVYYARKTRTLYVRDYKHGAGVAVEVPNNSQLLYYATGALLSNPDWRPTIVDVGVVQPRCPHEDGPVRSVRMPIVDLLEFIDELTAAVKRVDEPDAPCNPGDWCRWCPAAGLCPALRDKCVEAAKAEFRPDCSYVPEELADTLDLLPMVEAWTKSVREFAYAEAEHGRCPPRHKLVDKQARRKWKDEEEAVSFFEMLGFEEEAIYEPKSVRSVAQLEKAVGKEHRETVAQMVVKESSGLALVHESDKRPPAKVDAATEFSATD